MIGSQSNGIFSAGNIDLVMPLSQELIRFGKRNHLGQRGSAVSLQLMIQHPFHSRQVPLPTVHQKKIRQGWSGNTPFDHFRHHAVIINAVDVFDAIIQIVSPVGFAVFECGHNAHGTSALQV